MLPASPLILTSSRPEIALTNYHGEMSSGLEGRFGIPNASNDKMTRYDDDDKQFEGSSKYLSGQAGREHASLNPAHVGRHHRHLSSSLSLIADG
jgi:hypothetical protein